MSARESCASRNQLQRWITAFCVSLMLAMLAPSVVAAEEKPIVIETSKMQPSLVLGRPMLTWWDLKISTSGLMVGKFKFVIKNELEMLATTETEELTLNGPEQRIRVMLPSIDNMSPIDQLKVLISFRGKHFSGDLGEQILHVPFVRKKVFVGLVAESISGHKRAPRRQDLLDRLRFESVVPKSEAYRSAEMDRDYLKTIFPSVNAADLPSEPLYYCSYDLVVLAADEFRNLRKPQLDALLGWIKSGGSLYLEPQGVLESYHLEFLKNLVSDDPRGIVMQVDDAGNLLTEFAVSDGLGLSIACGLGHAAVKTTDQTDDDSQSDADWVKLIRPLWNSRLEILETPAGSQTYGNIYDRRMAQTPGFVVNTSPELLARSLSNPTRLTQRELLERLMPEGVRMVPLSVLASILLIFVLLIGPGDYFVLGWLRMRKFTWITFPLTTLIITALTVNLSNRYMSTAETRRAVVIRDLGPRGDVVRTNRFELLYLAASRWVTTDVEKGFFASLRTGGQSNQPNRQMNPRAGGYEFDEFDVSSISTVGRIPTQYAVSQNLSKWTPQINRIFSIPGRTEIPNVDWNQLNLQANEAEMLGRHIVPERIVKQIRQDLGPSALVACFTGQGGWANDSSTDWVSKRSPQNPVVPQWNAMNYGTVGIPDIESARGLGKPDFFLWLYRMSVGFPGPEDVTFSSTSALFSMIHRTAPTGSARCLDLPLLDTSDPGAWLLIAVVPGKEETIVYRKLMRFE